MKFSRRHSLLAAGALVAALALTGCSSGGRTEPATAGATGEVASTPAMKIAMVTHGAPGDAFFDIVRKGAETAAAKDNAEFLYASDPEGGRQAQLIEQFVDQKVDGLIVAIANPLAIKDSLKRAVEAGIPVMSINSGEEYSKEFGALAHFGSNDKVAGQAVGKELERLGFSKPLCLNQQQGAVNLEDRCSGIKEAMPDTETLYVQGTDMTDVASKLTSKLQTSKDIDVVVGMGAAYTMTSVQSVKDADSKAKVASFDLSLKLAEAIESGDVIFTIDQQPYLQGYGAVDGLWLNAQGGLVFGGGSAVLTGPAIVDASNVADVIKYTEAGMR